MTHQYPGALDFLLASRQCEIASLRDLLKRGKLIAEISRLIHELQRERGASVIWLCSAGALFDDELAQYSRAVDSSRKNLWSHLPSLPDASGESRVSSRLYSRIANAVQGLSQQEALRQNIRQRDIPFTIAIEQFNALIRQLLNLVFEMVDSAVDPEVTRCLIALFSFIQGKELAAQERALGASGFASGEFSAALSQQMVDLIEAQERCFQQFNQFADAKASQRWKQMAECDSEVERLRRIACTRGRAEDSGAAMALRWYQCLTRRIDGLKSMEERLADSLMQRCRQSIARAQAHNELDSGDLSRQMQQEKNAPAWSFYVGTYQDHRPFALGSDGVSPQVGRSLLTLLQQQSQRLQDQDGELVALRAHLDERKQIDRAKALLIRHHGLSEEQAWQKMRKMAMSQNKRMVEIAGALLAVADLFVTKPE